MKPLTRGALILTLFVTGLALDQFTKQSSLSPVLNSGFLFGSFSDLSLSFRTLLVVFTMCALLWALSFIQFLYWNQSPGLVFAISAFQTGVVGNGIDKIRFSAVRDFIPFHLFWGQDLTLNLADFYQLVSLPFILFFIWKTPSGFRQLKELRKKWWVYPKSQARIVAAFFIVSSVSSLVSLLIYFANERSLQHEVRFLDLLFCFSLIEVMSLLFLVPFAIVWSNRVYGPFKVVERFLNSNKSELAAQVRIGDEAECIQEILKLLREK